MAPQSKQKPAKKYTAQDLISRVDKLLDSLDFDLAFKFAQKAIALEPNNPRILEQLGTISMEIGDIETAQDCFTRLTAISPSFCSFLYLGQLKQGMDAVVNYQLGIQLLQKAIVAEHDADTKEALTQRLSTAYCSVAEIYMTDCCFEQDAEQKCLENVNLALEVDCANPDAHQTKASLLLSQQRPQEARETILRSCQIWLPSDMLSQLDSFADIDDMDETVELKPMPAYQARITLAKLLIELELFDVAIVVLQSCRDEDDESLDLWFIYGMCYWLLGGKHAMAELGVPADEDAQDKLQEYVEKVISNDVEMTPLVNESWSNSLDCLEEAKKIVTRDGCADEDFLEQIKELYQTLAAIFPEEEEDDTAMPVDA